MLTAVGFLILYGGLCLLSVCKHPVFGLAAYFAAFFLHPPDRWWGILLPDIRWSLLAALVSLLSVVIHKNTLPRKPAFVSQPACVLFLLFLIYLGLQFAWTMSMENQERLFVLYFKYFILIYLIYRILDSEAFLRVFLWSIVAGGFILGWIAFQDYTGGRFEGFGGAGVGDSNTGGATLVFCGLTAGSLFLATGWRERAALLLCGVFIVNGIVTTQSRSAFLALGVSAFAFYALAPSHHRNILRLLTLAGLAGFLLLTNPYYWARMASIEKAAVEGNSKTDYSAGRIVLMNAQLKMAKDLNFLGGGHRATALLSPQYLDDRYLTGKGEHRARSSHNTYLSLLVEHGVPGLGLWLLLDLWIFFAVYKLWRRLRWTTGLLAVIPPLLGGIFLALLVAGQFVDYLILEIRFWFLALTIVMYQWMKDGFPDKTGAIHTMAPARRSRFVLGRGARPETPGQPPAGEGRRRFVKR